MLTCYPDKVHPKQSRPHWIAWLVQSHKTSLFVYAPIKRLLFQSAIALHRHFDHPEISLAALACHTLSALVASAVLTLVASTLTHSVSPRCIRAWCGFVFILRPALFRALIVVTVGVFIQAAPYVLLPRLFSI